MKGKDILEKIYIEKNVCEKSLGKNPKSLTITIGIYLWDEIKSCLGYYGTIVLVDVGSNTLYGMKITDVRLNTLYGMKMTIDYDNPYNLSIGYCF
ncbi:hypothetical protein [[Clostridium] innocuum]|uniref:hypothetical protein n=1 Tax=Clostridium innocuum TaxID=1522 RepID=UPI001AF5FD6B|nr:hypothetical protein [[Clostridium] innocuum]QSI27811.1 hypothetical protein GKZ87_21040 [Erysipelotrichaceae bacterium 66202529]DAU14246.1 MAG TPA: hypothetical protein [Caudoviricetes sp.]MCC2832078.1 hypothetical protein [[Clostridium] innocuum]MCR0247004.1 hypothetical protein [[Clostridium] innocuum]MCR0258366.1 hypothetical protein [[Clostridium] innocuum]